MKTEKATVSYEVSKDKTVTREYDKLVFESADDVLEFFQKCGKTETKDGKQVTVYEGPTGVDLVESFKYGYDLKVKAQVRSALMSEAAGPDLALAKMAKDLVKLRATQGQTITEEAALAEVKKMFGAAS